MSHELPHKAKETILYVKSQNNTSMQRLSAVIQLKYRLTSWDEDDAPLL